MSELKAEIKAIQTELESIRANANEYQRRLAALVDWQAIEASFEPAASATPSVTSRQAAPRQVDPRQAVPPVQAPASRQSSERQVIHERQASHKRPAEKSQSASREVVLPEFNAGSKRGIQSAFQPSSSNPSLPYPPAPSRSGNADGNADRAVNQTSVPIQERKGQVEPLNPLSQTQDTTLRRLRSIAAQIEQERLERERLEQERLEQERRKNQSRTTLSPDLSDLSDLCAEGDRPESETATRSTPKLSLPPTSAESLTLRIHAPIDSSEAADQIAQMLRQRQEPREVYPDEPYAEPFVPLRRSRRRSTLVRRIRRWFARSSRSAADEAAPFTLRETLTLLLGAALTRLLLNLLLEAMPLLVGPVMILLLLPAAIAVHRMTTVPQSGILWGYRLCVVLLGLLIGGRL